MKKNSLKEFSNVLKTLQKPTPEEVIAFRKELLDEVLLGGGVMANHRERHPECGEIAERGKVWFATLTDSEREELVGWLKREKEMDGFEDRIIGYIVGGDNLEELSERVKASTILSDERKRDLLDVIEGEKE